MTQSTQPVNELELGHTSGSVVHSIVRFVWLLRRRKSTVLAALTVSGIMGVIYFCTATRIYQSKAQVLVRHSQPDSLAITLTADRNTQDQMATFQRLFTSAVVLNGALDKLSDLPPEIDVQDTRERALEELSQMVHANTLRSTSIIEVSCNSESATAAVRVVDAIVAAYLEYIDQNHQSVTAEVSSLLKKERLDLESRLQKAESELLAAKNQCADFGIEQGSDHPLIQNVVKINETLVETRQHRIQLEASLAAVRETMRTSGDFRQHLLALEPLLGEKLLLDAAGVNPQEATVVQEIERELIEHQAKLRTLGQHLGVNNPRIVELREKIRGGQQYIAAFQNRVTQRMAGMHDQGLGTMIVNLLEEDLARTWHHEQNLVTEYKEAEAKAIALNDRLSEVTIKDRHVQLLRNLHEALINRIENIDMNQNNSDVRVSIVSPPLMPDDPIRPILARVLFLCAALGLCVGAIIVYLQDVIDDRFRSPEEMQEQMGVPVLAMIRKHDVPEGVGLETLLVHLAPDAVESEAFRTLRTTLAFSGADCSQVVITSSEPSDGKTTVLANLGVSYAQAGKRTLLIDCDLRRPGLTNLFQRRRNEGVAEILREPEDIAKSCSKRVLPTGLSGLDFLPSGRRPADSAELLSRDRFADLVGWAETEYDQVLIDSPPVLAAADAAIAARVAGNVILVVQAQKNRRRVVLRALEGLNSLGASVLGTVVNAVSREEGGDYYGYGYGYYGYGYGYGYDENTDSDAANDKTYGSAEADTRSPRLRRAA